MKGILENFYKQIEVSKKLTEEIKVQGNINKIFILGMGGSALPGDLLECYLKDEKIPIFTVKDYNIPKFIDSESLVFVISFSGNTEESISAYREAMKTKAKIITISSGGKLKEIADMNKDIHIKVPSGLQPRQAIGYQFFPVLYILQNSGIITDRTKDIKDTENSLKKDIYKKSAQEMAAKLQNKIPIIYASTRMKIVAEKWKIGFNENTKTPSFYNVFPELNHNEMNGYINVFGDYFVIIIKDEDDHQRVKKRMKIFKEIIKDKGIEVVEMVIRGDCHLAKIFSGIYISDWVSYYLALLYGIDPSPVEIVELFKKKLNE
jgi:glucose/mannose-6-phosphate isomerase